MKENTLWQHQAVAVYHHTANPWLTLYCQKESWRMMRPQTKPNCLVLLVSCFYFSKDTFRTSFATSVKLYSGTEMQIEKTLSLELWDLWGID